MSSGDSTENEEQREHMRQYHRAWRAKNRDKVQVINKRYRETHPDQCAPRMRVYYIKNRNKRLAYAKDYRAKHRDQIQASSRERYAKNRMANLARYRRRRDERRKLLDEIKATTGCARCGEKDPACLDFHHRDRAAKISQVSWLKWRCLQIVLAEVAKCEIVCANCHRKHHAQSQPPSSWATKARSAQTRRPSRLLDHKARYRERNRTTIRQKAVAQNRNYRRRKKEYADRIKAGRGCRLCGENCPECLDFHHPDDVAKLAHVSNLKACAGWQVFVREIAKCDVFCANCHRKHHRRRCQTL